MTRLIDLGAASFETKQTFPAMIHQDGPQKLVENNIRYRAKSTPLPAEPKVVDPA